MQIFTQLKFFCKCCIHWKSIPNHITIKPQDRKVQDISNIAAARYNPGTRDIHALVFNFNPKGMTFRAVNTRNKVVINPR